MINKKLIVILAITLAGLLVIGAASAADVDANDTLSAGENEEIISVENDLDVLSEDKEEGTYQDLINEIGTGGDKKLNKSMYIYKGGDTITIRSAGVIDGNGAIIDMKGFNKRAFEVTTSGVTIKNLTIKNANFNGDGGAIYFDDKSIGTVTNCNFTGNKATGSNSWGGAILFASTGTVTNCNFTNNTAFAGGAVCFWDTGEVTNCNFTANQASCHGGAIYFTSSGTTHEVRNCNFTNNKATSGSGGAIFFASTGTVTNCNFTANQASGYGGAIYFSSSGTTHEVRNCNFTNNKATGSNSRGGAVYFNGEGTVTNCNFTNNTASENGGAIWFTGNGNVTNCNFTNNTASKSGGAVYFKSRGTAVNSNFVCNKATSECGGAIRFDSDGNVSNCNFTGNHACVASAIYFFSGSATKTISNSCFLNNRANAKPLNIICNENLIEITFSGENVLLNAIFFDGEITLSNVTYWGANGITNTDIHSPKRSANQAGQNITVTVVVNDILILNETKVTNENGTIVFDAVAGNCTVTARHNQDSYYTQVEKTETVNTMGNKTSLELSASGQTATAKITPNNITGNITFTVTNESGIVRTSESVITDGVAELDLSGLTAGKYNITAIYKGNNIYYPSMANITYDKPEFDSIIIIEVANITTDKNEIINITVNTAKDKNVTVRVFSDSFDITKTVTDGALTLTNLDESVYNVTVSWKGDGEYKSGINSTTFWAIKNIQYYANVTSLSTNNKTVNITAKSNIPQDILEGKLLFILPNSTEINATYASNGTWWALHTFDDAGDYNINATYIGLDNVSINNATISIRYDTRVDVNNKTLNLLVGDNFTIVATTVPEGVNVTFVQDDSGVYIVDKNGVVTALKNGTGSVLVKVGGDGVYAENSTIVNVTVSKVPTEISVLNDTLVLAVTDEVASGATLTPAQAGNVTYTISNSSVVKVEDGKIIALAEGKSTITVGFEGDKKYLEAENKTINVTVNLNDASVSVNNNTLDLFVDDTFNLIATAEPKGLTVNFTSDNSSVVTVDKGGNVVAVSEGTATITVSVGGDGIHVKNFTTVTVTVSKVPTEITVDPVSLDLFVGDETFIVSGLTPHDAGNVTFTSSNSSVVIVDGEGNVIANGKGQAIITVSFAGDNKYAACENKTVTVDVSLNDASVTVDNDTLDLKVDETYQINATKHPDTILLDITYKSSDNTVATVDENGIVTAVGEGTAIITVSVGDGEIYAENSTNVTVAVRLNDASVTAEDMTLDVYANATISHITSPAGLEVEYVSGNVSIAEVDANGVVTAHNAGNTTVTISIKADGIHAVNSTTINVFVNKINSTVDVNDVVLNYGETTNVSVTYDGAVGITAKLDGEEIIFSGNSVPIPVLNAGTYNLTVTTIPDDNHNAVSKTVTVTVLKLNTTVAIEMPANITVGENATVNVKLPSDATGTVSVKVDGSEVAAGPVTNGSAEITIPSLAAGNHTVEVVYSGDDKYNPTKESGEMTVSKQNATAEITVDDSSVNVKLPGDATGNVTVKVDGETVSTVPVSEGTASVELPKLRAGNHTVEVAYSGDGKYNPSEKTATVSVDNDTTNLTAKNVTATYKADKYLTITLTDSQGSPIANATVAVKLKSDKNYTTDENGQIKVKVSSLAPKTYTAEITFAGEDRYIGSNATAKVTVKKATPKIAAKSKSIQKNTKTKYTVKLTSNGKAIKNAKVYLIIGKSKYSANTDKNGKATFNIKLTKTGTYNAVIKFKENKFYKKATKKIKITVNPVWKTVYKYSKDKKTVEDIQSALQHKGYYITYKGSQLVVDGYYGPYTEWAVKEFQKAKGLKVTGSVDYATAKKLELVK